MTVLPLFNYQAEGADIMAGRERYGLHDEMGIGKTATTIGAINRIAGRRGIIICPAMLRENWVREFKKFSTYPLRICKGVNIHDYIAWSRDRFDVLICSYEQATKWAYDFNKLCEPLDFIAMDEAHFLKNPEAQRTMAVLGYEGSGGMVTWAEHAWHVTGTPMANDTSDAYTFLRFANAFGMSQSEFERTFFTSRLTRHGARRAVKDDMLPTLQSLIRNNSIKRTHVDVGMQLPPIFLTEMLIEGSTIELQDAIEAYPHLEDNLIYALETGDTGALDAAHIATIRRLVGKAKAVAYAKMLKSELDSGAGKRVAFFVHTEPLLHVRNHLAKYGYEMVVAYGDTPEHERQEAIHRFQNDPAVKAFGGNIKVAGAGITLTASCDVDAVESDWSPAGNAQALKRVHRYGQENAVRARFITLANSIDVAVNNIVARKTASIAEIEGHTMNASPLLT